MKKFKDCDKATTFEGIDWEKEYNITNEDAQKYLSLIEYLFPYFEETSDLLTILIKYLELGR